MSAFEFVGIILAVAVALPVVVLFAGFVLVFGTFAILRSWRSFLELLGVPPRYFRWLE